MLRQKIGKKNRQIQKDKERHRELIIKNQLLAYRSKELTRLKIKPYISPRSILLVDSAVYSDFFGYLDSIILEMSVSVVDIQAFEPSKKTLYMKGNFREVYNYTLNNG